MKNVKTLLFTGAMAVFTGNAVYAQAFSSVSAVVERVENPALASVSPGGATVLRISPDYALETQGDRYRSRLSLGAVLESSSNTALVANRNYPSLGYTWAYAWPTAGIEFRANLAEAATRNTELQDLGRITVDSRERSIAAGARWNQELTERTRLTADVSNTRVSYDSTLLEGYRELAVSGQVSWDSTERTVYYFEPTYRRLIPAGAGEESTQARWLVGMRGDLAPDWSLSVFAGQARIESLQSFNDSLGGARLAYNGSRLSSAIEWTRDVVATGVTPGYVRTKALGLRLGYQITDSATLSASLTNSQSAGITGGRGRVSGLILENEVSARWSSTLGIEDRWSRDFSGTTARGWSVRAGLVYAYPGR